MNLFSQTEERKTNLTAGISGVPLLFNSNDGSLSIAGFALKSSFGVFLNKNLSLENNVFYYNDKDVFNNKSQIQSTSYGIQISLRYHYALHNNVKIYLDAGAGFGSVQYTDDYNNGYSHFEKYNSGIVVYTASLGGLLKLFPNFDLELALPYLAVFNTTNDLNIYGKKRGNLLYGAMAGPTLGFRYSF